MDNNTPYDKSGYPPPRQGTYHKRIDAFITRIEDRITLLLEGISIDELSAYERFQLAAKSDGLLLRLLPLLEKVEADEIGSQSKNYPRYSSEVQARRRGRVRFRFFTWSQTTQPQGGGTDGA